MVDCQLKDHPQIYHVLVVMLRSRLWADRILVLSWLLSIHGNLYVYLCQGQTVRTKGSFVSDAPQYLDGVGGSGRTASLISSFCSSVNWFSCSCASRSSRSLSRGLSRNGGIVDVPNVVAAALFLSVRAKFRAKFAVVDAMVECAH